MYDRPPRARVAPQVHRVRVEPGSQQVKVDSVDNTVGSASPAPSNIWSARERARAEDLALEQREAERLKGVLQICRAC